MSWHRAWRTQGCLFVPSGTAASPYPVEMKRTRITWTYGTTQPGGIKCRIRCEGIIHPEDGRRMLPEDSTRILPIATLVVSLNSSSGMIGI